VKVLLTGANGFVGSHVLDHLLASGHAVTVLLRTTSDTTLIAHNLGDVRVRYGSLSDVESLRSAARGTEVVIHCAGKTKAVRNRQYYDVNARGTANLVEACNGLGGCVKHLIFISSLAAAGPGTLSSPATEDGAPHPVSDYGRSKLMGERHVVEGCVAPYTILRPGAIYGPGDRDFLLLFKTIRARLLPILGARCQRLSFVYAGDVARAVLLAMGNPRAFGRIYHVANPEPATAVEFAERVAALMKTRPIHVPVPFWALYLVCVGQEALARLTHNPGILNIQKMREYKAPGWVCSVQRIQEELGFAAQTPLQEGIATTLRWYERHGWL